MEAIEGLDDAGSVAEMLPGASEEVDSGVAGMEGALAFDFVAEDAGFERGDAHVFEISEVVSGFGGSGRWRRRRGRREAGLFAENVARVEAVAAGVLRRAAFAGGGAGAAGFGAVEAGSLALQFGSHKFESSGGRTLSAWRLEYGPRSKGCRGGEGGCGVFSVK